MRRIQPSELIKGVKRLRTAVFKIRWIELDTQNRRGNLNVTRQLRYVCRKFSAILESKTTSIRCGTIHIVCREVILWWLQPNLLISFLFTVPLFLVQYTFQYGVLHTITESATKQSIHKLPEKAPDWTRFRQSTLTCTAVVYPV